MRQYNNNNNSTGGINFLNIILAVFIALKFAKVIDWSWWVVLIPLWIEFAIFFIVFIILYVISWCNKNDKWKF